MSASPDRILTLHPDGKQGVHIERSKYDLVRAALLELVPADEEGIALGSVRDALADCLHRRGFPREASVGWYTIAVKQDLEARGELEIVPGKRPQHLRRTAR